RVISPLRHVSCHMATIDWRSTTVDQWSGGGSDDGAGTVNRPRGTTQVVTRGKLIIELQVRGTVAGQHGDGIVPTPCGTTQVVTRGILMIRCQVAGTRYCSSEVAEHPIRA
ncbi:hypothetical protein Tco_0677311, partial [Tanacetum coccineum]